MQAENQPLPEETEKATTPLDSSQRLRLGSGASILKFLKNNILKPRPQHTEIHSGSIMEGEQGKTLAPFAMSGVTVGRVNRDYEAFLTPSAWGSTPPQPSQKSSSASSPGEGGVASNGAASSATTAGSPHSEQTPEGNARGERFAVKERPNKPLPIPAGKPRSRTSGDVLNEPKGEGPRQPQHALHSPQLPRAHHALGQSQQQQQQHQQPPQPPLKRAPLLPPANQQKAEVHIKTCTLQTDRQTDRPTGQTVVDIKRTPSSLATLGTSQSFLIRGVASFQG